MPVPTLIDITGQPFGDLTARRMAGRNDRGQILWECECKCGATRTVESQALRRRNGVRGCEACVRAGRMSAAENLVGAEFGELIVLRHHSPQRWVCRCKLCGREAVKLRRNLRHNTRTCGRKGCRALGAALNRVRALAPEELLAAVLSSPAKVVIAVAASAK